MFDRLAEARAGRQAGRPAWMVAPALVTMLVLGSYLVYALAVPHRALLPGELGYGFKPLDPHLDPLLHWDGGWFSYISLNGYRPIAGSGQQPFAFFPLFPFLVRALHLVLPFASLYGGGIVINLAAVTGAMLLVDRTVRTWPGWQRAGLVALLVTLPGAMFYACFYSEGLFVLAVALALWGMLTPGRLAWAALGVVIATLDRTLGALLLVPVAAAVVTRRREIGMARTIGLLILAAAGIPAILAIYTVAAHDPLAFYHVRGSFGEGHNTLSVLRHGEWVASVYPLHPRTLLHTLSLNPLDAINLVEAGLALPALVLAWLWHRVLGLYAAAVAFISVISGGWANPSVTRYLLVVLPLWIGAVAIIRRRPQGWAPLAVLVVLGFWINLWMLDRFVLWQWAG